jgi:hypothetical protein
MAHLKYTYVPNERDLYKNLVKVPMYFLQWALTKMHICSLLPWRRGIEVIADADITEDPGFESRQGIKFICLYTLQCCR